MQTRKVRVISSFNSHYLQLLFADFTDAFLNKSVFYITEKG